MYTDSFQFQYSFHCVTDLFFYIVTRCNIVTVEIFKVRFRECGTIEFAVCFQRYTVYLYKTGRYHIIRQTLLQFLSQFFRVKIHIGIVIRTKIASVIFFKTACGCPVYSKHLLYGGFYFRRFYAVAVYLYHITLAAEKNIITVAVFICQISRMIIAVNKSTFCFFG